MKKYHKAIKVVLTILLIVIIITSCGILLLNKFSIPSKDKRIENMIMYNGSSDLNCSDVAHEIKLTLSWPTNWDNLLLSESFKSKFKNRKGIVDDIRYASDVWCGTDSSYGEENTIIVYVNQKEKLFDKDESDNTSTKYRFTYKLDDNGEIDDLILEDKQIVYTINGEPVN